MRLAGLEPARAIAHEPLKLDPYPTVDPRPGLGPRQPKLSLPDLRDLQVLQDLLDFLDSLNHPDL